MNVLTEQIIIDLITKHIDKLNPSDLRRIAKESGAISPVEGLILYCLALEIQPRYCIEFSPHVGYSTMSIAMGMRAAARPNVFKTFEIINEGRIKNELLDRIKIENLTNYVEVIFGDVQKTLPAIIATLPPIDLCFIDSEHSKEFAQWYVDDIFPYLAHGCTVLVHDISSEDKSPHGKFKSSLIPLHPNGAKDPIERNNYDEPIVVTKYLSQHNIPHTVLHAIFGGKHENCIDIPNNKNLFQLIEKITKVNFASPVNPKSVFFRIP